MTKNNSKLAKGCSFDPFFIRVKKLTPSLVELTIDKNINLMLTNTLWEKLSGGVPHHNCSKYRK